MRVSNNVLFLFSLIFFLITVINLVTIWKSIPEVSTGQATSQQGIVSICISHNITILSESFTGLEYTPFYDVLVVTNPDNRTLRYSENATFFEIDPYTGIIDFTPVFDDFGLHVIEFSIQDLDPICTTLKTKKLINFTIHHNRKDANLAIWDDTDEKGGNQTKFIHEAVTLYANYTSAVTNLSINDSGSFCVFSQNNTGTFSRGINMTFNRTLLLYTASAAFDHPGEKRWNVSCWSEELNFTPRSASDSLWITNRPPVQIAMLPNESWSQNSILTGRDLDDYFIDPDGDPLSFNSTAVNNINVTISPATHVVTFNPVYGFYGNRTVLFYAIDPFHAETESNLVYLYVIYRPPPPVENPPKSSGGAGGGGGGGAPTYVCMSDWQCTPWEKCLPSGIQRRKCVDANLCNFNKYKPNETQNCTYIPTCDDLIRNQNETGVDCGGPCPVCPTCNDSIQNQGEIGVDCGGPCYPCGNCTNQVKDCHNASCELGIDCGGPCAACPTCNDGIQNQDESGIDCGGHCGICPTCNDGKQNGGENGIDCGGPCGPCLRIELPAFINRSLIPLVIFLILAILAIAYLSFRFYRRTHQVLGRMARWVLSVRRSLGLAEKPLPETIKLRAAQLLSLQRIERLLGKAKPDALVSSLNENFLHYVRSFIHTPGELTHEEMLAALKRSKMDAMKKMALTGFLQRLQSQGFSGKASSESIRSLIKEAHSVLDATAPAAKEEEKRALTEAKTESLEAKISEMRAHRKNGDLTAAVAAYRDIKAKFPRLSEEEQRRLYPKLTAEYAQLSKAMGKGK